MWRMVVRNAFALLLIVAAAVLAGCAVMAVGSEFHPAADFTAKDRNIVRAAEFQLDLLL